MATDDKKNEHNNDDNQTGTDGTTEPAVETYHGTSLHDDKNNDDSKTTETNTDYKDIALRAQADYQNLKKEVAAQRSEWAKMSRVYVLEEFIPILENFKKAYAFETGNDVKQFENWKKGIEFIKKQFEDKLKEHGVEPIETVGKPFDPTLHEAAGEEASDDVEEGCIIREIEGGYMVGDRILQVAKVIVSKS